MRSLGDLAAAWEARPRTYSRVVWALVLALDALPWPWGEEILARCFVARAFVRTARLRRALAWAGAQPGGQSAWARRLYRARQIVLEGGTVFISADGGGAQALSIPLPGGPALIGAGWLLLRRTTKATVLPVLSHMDGRVQVVTIHPPLPAPLSDPALHLEACRRAVGELLGQH